MGREFATAADGGGRCKPRLFIEKMALENFKSYAGKQYIGPFHKCFSAVIGPNGSGKSSVIDAMLFVFGKRVKLMRLNKVSELIHNSTNHQSLDKASVSVHFQEIIDLDNDRYEVVPGSDFLLTRVAFGDNTSKYYLDGRASTFTEVTKILMAKGIDLEHNRFLILQGEVELISLMKPKAQTPHDEGFPEYLEDIIGSNKYVERIDAASKQLEELNEKKNSMVQRVRVVGKEKSGLEDAKDEAEQFMLKEAELFKWKTHVAELTLKEASAEAEGMKKKVTELEDALKQEREKYGTYSAEIKELEKKLKRETKHREGIQGELNSCSDQFKGFERQDLKYQGDLKHLKQKMQKLEDKIAKDTGKIDEVEKETAESTVMIPKMEAEVVQLTEQLGEEEKALEALQEACKGEIEKYRELLNTARVELEPWEKHIIECESKIGVTSSASKLLKDKHEAGGKAYDAALEKVQETKLEYEEKEADLVRLTAELACSLSSLTTAREEEQEGGKSEESLQAQKQALQQKVGEMCALIDTEKNQSSVVKAILQAKESGQIEGIYGRLGDLGAIDAKYDVAISTACGGLDFIVVETTSAAQACVELLRTKQLGAATFLILDNQSGLMQRMNEGVQTPENAPRLFDLICVRDDRLRLAFCSQLGNTVVANYLDQDISKTSTEINRRQVQISTSSKIIQKLKKSVEDGTKDIEKLTQDKENTREEFKNVEAKAFVIQQKFIQLQEIFAKDTEELEVTKKDYLERKNIVNVLRTMEIDTDFKLKDTKEICRLWEGKTETCKKELKGLSKELQNDIEQIQKEGIDLALLEVYIKDPSAGISIARAQESIKVLEAQIKELQPSLDSIAELDEFMGGFNSISMKLKEMYQMITLGGDAELELVDSLDPFAEGVVFTVRPPKKSWKTIANLSGGEKTLSSLALVFALHHYKPTPLYVMDEINAALDFKDVSIVGHYIQERTKDAQFIIISLRNNMFELAGYLIGIYKADNCTKSISINPHNFLVPVSSDGQELR